MAISNPERTFTMEDIEGKRRTFACFNESTGEFLGSFTLPAEYDGRHTTFADARRHELVVFPVKENVLEVSAPGENVGDKVLTIDDLKNQLDTKNSKEITGFTLEDFKSEN